MKKSSLNSQIKKMIAGFLTVFMTLGSGLMMPLTAWAATNGTTNCYLNLRDDYSTNGSIITTLPDGQSVVIENTYVNSAGETWYELSGVLSNGNAFIGYSIATGVDEGSSAAAGTSGYVNCSALNLRTGAGTDYTAAAVLTRGQEVSIITSAGEWYQVSANGIIGYVYAAYISSNSDSDADDIEDITDTQGYVNTSAGLNLRSGVGTMSKLLTTLAHNTVLTIEAQSRDSSNTLWYKVVAGSYEGFVCADYVTVGSPSSGETQTEDIAAYVNSSAGLNVRTGAGTNYQAVNTLSNHTALTIKGEAKDSAGTIWYKITTGSITGYVSSAYVTKGTWNSGDLVTAVDNVAGYVNSSAGLNVRTGMGTDHSAITTLKYQTTLTITGEGKDSAGSTWYRIEAGSIKGYVSAAYVTKGAPDTSNGAGNQTAAELRNSIAAYAQTFVGKLEYVWGGTSLVTGADCSGFVYALYKEYGIDITRNMDTMLNQGIEVSPNPSQLLPGDLIFYHMGSQTTGIGHVAMYIGNGQVCHSSSPDVDVVIYDYDYKTPLRARRIIQ